MGFYDSVDLAWSWNGDLDIDQMGDIKDTSDNFLQALIDTVQVVVKSERFDWEKDPLLGASITDFQGEPNNRNTGKAIEDRIKISLISQNIVESTDIDVKVVPVHNQQVLISIIISCEPTVNNGLSSGEPVQVSLIYDTLENTTFFLLDNSLERAAR